MEEKKTNEEDDVPFISQQQEKNEGNPLKDKRFLELTNVVIILLSLCVQLFKRMNLIKKSMI